jgi:DNA-binding GntR family transcriptional regulator
MPPPKRISHESSNVSSARAYDHIRKRILNGEYPPGKTLNNNVLSDEIGVSRTPVRDALRQLEVEGLISIRPRLGSSVRTMDFKEFEEMNELRVALECHAANLAAKRRSHADLEAIKAPLEALRTAIESYIANYHGEALPKEVVSEDIEFHIAILNAAKNDLIKKEIFRLHLIHRIVSAPTVLAHGSLRPFDRATPITKHREVAEEHRTIYEAISNCDAAAARSAMEHHLLNNIHGLFILPKSENSVRE